MEGRVEIYHDSVWGMWGMWGTACGVYMYGICGVCGVYSVWGMWGIQLLVLFQHCLQINVLPSPYSHLHVHVLLFTIFS